jgi:type II secretory pathway pseudopilin PulG
MNKQKGFTKVEAVIVVILLLLLGTIIYIAVDPRTRLQNDRDNRRRSEVVAILNAVLKYQTMNNNSVPAAIDANPGTAQVIGVGQSGCDAACGAATTETACADLSPALVDAYLEEIPYDPTSGSPANTDYYINVTSGGRILVGACDPEISKTISVTR